MARLRSRLWRRKDGNALLSRRARIGGRSGGLHRLLSTTHLRPPTSPRTEVKQMSWTPDACIYHFPCHDGFASYVIARRRWPDLLPIPKNYGQELPPLDWTEGKNILIADFSLPPDKLKALKAQSIVILDHHKTAMKDLEQLFVTTASADDLDHDLKNADWHIVANFDMKRSGVRMTWDFCFPREPPPRLIKYIEDRDLWIKKYPESRRV